MAIEKVKTNNLDFVYILGKGSKWNNNEIKYSIRSVERHVPHRNIVIVGELPHFLNRKKIIHISVSDKDSNKLKNAINKLMYACRDPRISKDFVLMNDDFIFTQDIDGLYSYTIGTLDNAKKKHTTKGGYYFRAICDTLDILNEEGYDTINYEVHYPMIINQQKFLRMIKMHPYWKQLPFLFRSVYGNMYRIPSYEVEDFKFYIRGFRFKDFVDKVEKWGFVSTDNQVVMRSEFQEWIKKRFPHSIYYEI